MNVCMRLCLRIDPCLCLIIRECVYVRMCVYGCMCMTISVPVFVCVCAHV